jgi:hypothetical protein
MKIATTQLRKVFFFIIFMYSTFLSSQGTSRDFKHTVKFNVSNILLYDNSCQFSYERIIKENQSLNVFVGDQEFPLITIDIDGVNFDEKNNRTGFSVGADYRFIWVA